VAAPSDVLKKVLTWELVPLKGHWSMVDARR
jgi:hypothetical protein